MKKTARILVVDDEEHLAAGIRENLEAEGYRTEVAHDGATGLARLRSEPVDLVVLDQRLPTIDGIEVCAQLRNDARFDASTPIVIAGASTVAHTLRTRAYAAGAWEFCTHPIDTDTLLLKLDTFLRARRAAVEAVHRAHFDDRTGLLTPMGLEHWAEHLAARAARKHEALACVVLMPVGTPARSDSDSKATMDAFLELARDAFRRSDVVGSTSDGRIALIAPDTDAEGVRGFLARLRGAVARAAGSQPTSQAATQFRAGYWAVEDFSTAAIDPAEVVRRAINALDSDEAADSGFPLGFDRLSLS